MNTTEEQIKLRSAAKPHRQISLAAMMLAMLVFTMMSIALFYATRIEAIQDELSLLFGSSAFGDRKSDRRSHLIFLLFTYASPLMLALVLSTVHGIMNRRR